MSIPCLDSEQVVEECTNEVVMDVKPRIWVGHHKRECRKPGTVGLKENRVSVWIKVGFDSNFEIKQSYSVFSTIFSQNEEPVYFRQPLMNLVGNLSAVAHKIASIDWHFKLHPFDILYHCYMTQFIHWLNPTIISLTICKFHSIFISFISFAGTS